MTGKERGKPGGLADPLRPERRSGTGRPGGGSTDSLRPERRTGTDRPGGRSADPLRPELRSGTGKPGGGLADPLRPELRNRTAKPGGRDLPGSLRKERRGAAGQAAGRTGKPPKAGADGGDRRMVGGQPPRKRLSAREVALNTLVKVAEAGAYSHLQLNRALEEAQLSRQDGALATELVYGTIQHQRTLDYRLADFVARGLDKLAPWVRQLLRMSAYQLLYLDRIPAHAAVNEAVAIAKRRGHAGISGMTNGVLRNMVRKLAELKEPIEEADPVRRIGLTYSYPDWLVKRWIEAYGEETAEAICAAGNASPHAGLRVNRLRMTRDEALAALAGAGISAEPSRLSPAGIVLQESAGHLAASPEFAAGQWSLQDESSMLVAEVCAPRPGMAVLDCCAAPGGKAAHLAELMADRGRIVANDIHAHKRKLIEDQARRLGLASVEAATGDAAELTSRYAERSFDLVLLDAPCSGFGVIRRKPEIKWTKAQDDIRAIADTQRRLLDEAAGLVKPGGTLVYSTCTIEREENEAQLASFLERHGDFRLDPDWPKEALAALREAGAAGADFGGSLQLLPQHFGSDGFYIARLKRIR